VDTTDALSRLAGVRQTAPNQWESLCPVHEADGGEHKPSLSITAGRNGQAIVHCQAGCSYRDILAAIGDAVPVTPAPRSTADRGRIVATYPYTDEAGTLLYEAVRFEPKDFRQCRPDGTGGRIWNMKGVRRVLYRLGRLDLVVTREAADPFDAFI